MENSLTNLLVRDDRDDRDCYEVERQTLVGLHTLRSAQDSDEPVVRNISESEWSFTFLYRANYAVKRLGKVGGWQAAQGLNQYKRK